MDAPLVSEDTDPERLLQTINDLHGDRAEILYQDSVRRGGLFGFFAREVHRAAYRIRPHQDLPAIDSTPSDPFDDLIAEADEAETESEPIDFAHVLQAITSRDETVAGQTEIQVPSNVTELKGNARAKLAMLMKLREVGVPVTINPRGEAHGIYEAMEQILAELPEAPAVPRLAGEIVALVGELSPTLRTAASIAALLRIDETEIVIAGLNGHPVTNVLGGGPRAAESVNLPVINTVTDAARRGFELTAQDRPAIVVIATDTVDSDPDDIWAAGILRALQPTAAWLVVDATRKPEDNRSALLRIGAVDAIAVHSAQLSASPATVWDLGLPIALLDGRPATTFAWSGLLFGALRSGADHPATHRHARVATA
jgi:hypothetical protein